MVNIGELTSHNKTLQQPSMGNNKKKIQRVIVSGFLYSAGLVFKSNEGTETHFLLASLLRALFFSF